MDRMGRVGKAKRKDKAFNRMGRMDRMGKAKDNASRGAAQPAPEANGKDKPFDRMDRIEKDTPDL